MRIVQALQTLSYGDAIGNDTLAIDKVIRKMGIRTTIYCENRDHRIPAGICKSIIDMPRLKSEDVLLYHLSLGTDLNYKIASLPCKIVIIYHNITPPDYFIGVNSTVERNCRLGRLEAAFLAEYADHCLADSEYNKTDLLQLGYKCPIDVIPILIPFNDYDAQPNDKVLSEYACDEFTNLLFVGRIAPNKKHEDLIASFFYYQKYYNRKSRLFLVGSHEDMDAYYSRLISFVHKLGVRNVIFTGKVAFSDILSYYRLADVFLCMSEHEGFCVPLAESMKFNLPIVAYNSSAIGETLGGAGVLLDDKNPLTTAGVVNHLINNRALQEKIALNRMLRMHSLSPDVVEPKLRKCLEGLING